MNQPNNELVLVERIQTNSIWNSEMTFFLPEAWNIRFGNKVTFQWLHSTSRNYVIFVLNIIEPLHCILIFVGNSLIMNKQINIFLFFPLLINRNWAKTEWYFVSSVDLSDSWVVYVGILLKLWTDWVVSKNY